MTLKTLKDIEMCNPPRPHTKSILKELKQEAIKWVKYFLINEVPMTELSFCKFHNISEEDLK